MKKAIILIVVFAVAIFLLKPTAKVETTQEETEIKTEIGMPYRAVTELREKLRRLNP